MAAETKKEASEMVEKAGLQVAISERKGVIMMVPSIGLALELPAPLATALGEVLCEKAAAAVLQLAGVTGS